MKLIKYIDGLHDGKYHRLDGPALIDGKYKIYKLHRDDGPAIIDEINKIYQWCIHGVNITEEITTWLQDNEIDWMDMSLIEKIMLTLEFNNE